MYIRRLQWFYPTFCPPAKNFQTINIGVICPNEIVELSYFIEYKFI